MIDSGEDWDYADGSDPRYPFRTGIQTRVGFDMQVIRYLESVGVNQHNFDFYIGTHAHGDHIGIADDVIPLFRPATVYLKRYADSQVTGKGKLYDNLYVYDRMMAAAAASGIPVVQDIAEGSYLSLGDIDIQFFNTAVRNPVFDENENSIVTKLTINGTTTVLTGDANLTVINELINAGILNDVDIYKLPHHGLEDANNREVLTAISPKVVVLTAPMGYLFNRPNNDSGVALEELGIPIVTTTAGVEAVITEYSNGFAAGYEIFNQNVDAHWWSHAGDYYYIKQDGSIAYDWQEIEGKWYYFNRGRVDRGRALTGWHKLDGSWFYLSESGANQGEMLSGWQKIDGTWYYLSGANSGKMLDGWQKLGGRWYHLGGGSESGKMSHGWQKIGGSWYYFGGAEDGRMAFGWQKIGGAWYYLGSAGDGQMATGWRHINGTWYNFASSGVWIG